MMLLGALFLASIYILSGYGRINDWRFISGSLLMLLYLGIFYLFPVAALVSSVYIGRLTQYLPILSYGVILFGSIVVPSDKSKYIHFVGFLGLIITTLIYPILG